MLAWRRWLISLARIDGKGHSHCWEPRISGWPLAPRRLEYAVRAKCEEEEEDDDDDDDDDEDGKGKREADSRKRVWIDKWQKQASAVNTSLVF
ncbi:hypothetical protein ColKHC_03793 [Colletotrichum higginsianum]|nr:hypothetical protein ColKHC_03793 [Colletotrichum higginsianum]